MSNDIGKAVDMLQKMLQDDDARENLQTLVGQVVGAESDEEATDEDNSDNGFSLPAELENINLGALINSAAAPDDKRIAFLKALKPYLNSRRQEKTDNAISIMKFVNLSSTFGIMDMFK